MADPAQTAQNVSQQQLALNQQLAELQARLNRFNQYGPFGSVTWAEGPGGQWSQSTQLSPEQQQLYNQQLGRSQFFSELAQQLLPQIQGSFNSPLDFSQFAEVALPNQNWQGRTQDVENRIYDQYKRRLDDQYARERESLEQQLANRGQPITGEYAQKVLADFDRRKSDSYLDAQTTAMQIAFGEDSRLFDIARQQYELGNAARSQKIGEYLQQRGNPLSEYAQLVSGITPTQFPTQQPIGEIGVAPVDYAGLYSSLRGQDKQLSAARSSSGAALEAARLNASAAMQRQIAGLVGEGLLNEQRFNQSQALQGRAPSSTQQFVNALGPGVAQGVGKGIGGAVGRLF